MTFLSDPDTFFKVFKKYGIINLFYQVATNANILFFLKELGKFAKSS